MELKIKESEYFKAKISNRLSLDAVKDINKDHPCEYVISRNKIRVCN